MFTFPAGHRVFDSAAAAIGVPPLTPHDLRHNTASLAIQAGADVKAVQRMLGHASAAMTLHVHAGRGRPGPVAERLDEAAARARADSSADSAAETGRPAVRPRGATCGLTWETFRREGGARTRDPRIMSPLL